MRNFSGEVYDNLYEAVRRGVKPVLHTYAEQEASADRSLRWSGEELLERICSGVVEEMKKEPNGGGSLNP